MRLQKEIRFISAFRVINLNYMLKIIKILRKGCNWFVTTLRLINIYFPCLFGGDHTHGGPAASPYFAGSCVYAEVRKKGGRIGLSMTGACEGHDRHHHLATCSVFLRLPFCMSMVSLCPQTQPFYSLWFDGFTVLIYTVNKLRQKYKDKTHFLHVLAIAIWEHAVSKKLN